MSTLSVSPGYVNIEEEFEASLCHAFAPDECGRVADYLAVYSRRQRFQWECAEYGVKQGWLTGEFVELDEQSSEIRYRLTDTGKAHFGVRGEL